MRTLMALALFCCVHVAHGQSRHAALSDKLLDAIRQVESNGDDSAVGDKGKAIGPYQIWKDYWKDACEYDPSLKSGTYEDCFDPSYAKRVVIAYLSRYGKGKSADDLVRIHNGGPSGHKKSSTKAYLAKIRRELKKN